MTTFSGIITPQLPIIDFESSSGRLELLSGIEINQNTQPTIATDYVNPINTYWQTFVLPSDYERADSVAPDITGFQICVNNPPSTITPTINYTLMASGSTLTASGYIPLASGVVTGIHANGPQVWADIYLEENIPVTPQLLGSTYALGVRASGVEGWWYSDPNPYAGGLAYEADMMTPLNGTIVPSDYLEPSDLLYPNDFLYPEGQESDGTIASFMFRLLSYSADHGTDWLGNSWRDVVLDQAPQNINTFETTNPNAFWLSQPNPSKFAVEVLYFDISDAFGNPQVFDRLFIEPITQGPAFNVYYSTDTLNPPQTIDDWNNLLWQPVSGDFRLFSSGNYAMPSPVIANYVAIEFSRLQAQYYSAGTYQQPILYNKYPQWVINYFIPNIPQGDYNIGQNLSIVYNKLQFAYDYYLDDLQSQPLSPTDIEPNTIQSVPTGQNLSNQITASTLSQINTIINPYTLPPGYGMTGQTALSNFLRSTINLSNYTVESLSAPTAANTSMVSTINRDQIYQEENQPNLSFPITCRHTYQVSQAEFEYNRAYWVGIRNLAFLREDYTVPYDQALYIESTGDDQNLIVNDFYNNNGTWQVLNPIQYQL